jgi:hypothetical protein
VNTEPALEALLDFESSSVVDGVRNVIVGEEIAQFCESTSAVGADEGGLAGGSVPVCTPFRMPLTVPILSPCTNK